MRHPFYQGVNAIVVILLLGVDKSSHIWDKSSNIKDKLGLKFGLKQTETDRYRQKQTEIERNGRKWTSLANFNQVFLSLANFGHFLPGVDKFNQV